MPKLKTHSGAKKRFKKTATGKIKRKKSGGRHLQLGKGNSRLRRLKEAATIHPTQQERIGRLLPYA